MSAIVRLAHLHVMGVGAAVLAATMPPMVQPPAGRGSSTLCVIDAVTRAPLVGVTVMPRDSGVGLPRSALLSRDACIRLTAGVREWRVVRVGYRSRIAMLDAAVDAVVRDTVVRDTVVRDTVVIALSPVTVPAAQESAAVGVARLAAQRVRADRDRAGRTSATLGMADARERGAATVNGVLALLPYVQLRSARGESGLSLRGARREQVVVTLDGLPLNDPATGLADVSDLPLVALATATVAPGADPLGAGSGASGGVLALTTGARREASLRTGSFGSHLAEGAWSGTQADLRWHAAASWRTVRNDFAFVNDAAVTPVRELRVNADERRVAANIGAVAAHTQWSLLASSGERGMVGPANVRTYDADRARTDRVVTRLQQSLGSTVASVGGRWFSLGYRDPTRPAFDNRARAWAVDADWRGPFGPGSWRIGIGGDRLHAQGASSAPVRQSRARAYAAYGAERTRGAWRLEAGARVDHVEGQGPQPTGSLGGSLLLREGSTSRLTVVARAAQAIRVPTLYDLYFASPQRLTVRALDPERVTLDANIGVTGAVERHVWRATGELLAVQRDTRNAIIWFPGNFGWSPANVGHERVRGLESRVAVSRVAGGPRGSSRGVHASGWLTVYDAALRTSGPPIPTPYVPRMASGMQLAAERGTSVLSANVRYQGRRPFTVGPRDPFFELPAVWLTDLALARRVTMGHTEALLSLSFDNLLDARWQSVRGFPMPGRAWSLGITLQPAAQAHSPEIVR